MSSKLPEGFQLDSLGLVVTSVENLERYITAQQQGLLEEFRLFVFGRHYDGTFDGSGATFNGMVDTELREFARIKGELGAE